ncbi:MAG: tetratricopeptide repeat protein [Minisyncoccia bacterium]
MPPQTTTRRRFSLDVAGTWALLITLILAAIAITPWNVVPISATKAFIVAAGAIVTLALYIVARLSRGNVVFPPVLLIGILWLPALAYFLSALFSGAGFTMATFGAALDTDTFGFILAATVLGTLLALVIRRAGDFIMFFRALGWTLGIVAVIQILIVIVGQFAPTTISPAFSLFGSLSDLGAVSGLALVLGLIALRTCSLSSRSRAQLYVLGALGLCLLALADSFLLWVLVALSSLALFVEGVMRRAPSSSGDDLEGAEVLAEDSSGEASDRPLAAPLVVLAISLFFLIGGTLGGALVSGLHVNVLDVRPSWQSTLATGSSVYHSSPIFGSGPGTFGARWLITRDASLNETVFSNINFTSGIGFIPTSFVTTGLLGVLAWVVLLGAFLYFGLRALLVRIPEDPVARYAALAGFIGFAYLAALLIFDVPGPVPTALLFIFGGLFASTLRYARGSAQWGIVFGRSPRIGFVIVFGLTLLLLASIGSAYVLVERYVAITDLGSAEAALNAGNPTTAIATAQSSLSFAPSVAAYEVQALAAGAQMNSIANNSTLSQSDAQTKFQAALSSGINAALTATRLAPSDYTTWLSLGNLYAAVVPLNVSGSYADAKAAYQKAAALNPTSPTIPYLMAQLDVANKDNASAEADLKQAIALQQNDTQAILLLSQLEVADGNVKDALTAAEAAAYFTPTDPNVLFQLGVLQAATGDLTSAVSSLSAAVSQQPSFANARYILAAVYAKQGDYQDALVQIQAIAALSDQNKQAVAADITALSAGKDPFPPNLLQIPPANLSQ